MKRLYALAAALLLLFSLTSCGIHDYADFYYCRKDYIYESQQSVIEAESREVTGHAQDLSYLLALYLIGPLEENLQSPFPAGTRLVSIAQEGTSLTLQLSRQAGTLSDSEFSLACACMAMTCLEMDSLTDITITSEEKSLTINRDLLMLSDNTSTESTNGGN